MSECPHEDFLANVDVNRLVDSGRFQADVRIQCTQCETPFRFIGLPVGLDLNGAAVNMDATEARLAVAPKGEVIPALDGAPQGFSVRIDSDDPGFVAALRIQHLESELAAARQETTERNRLTHEALEKLGKVDAELAAANRLIAVLQDPGRCPVCKHQFEMGQPPHFKAEESGSGFDGERAVHWHSGTQTCPNCAATWHCQDSD